MRPVCGPLNKQLGTLLQQPVMQARAVCSGLASWAARYVVQGCNHASVACLARTCPCAYVARLSMCRT
jgi:hypothetical protein